MKNNNVNDGRNEVEDAKTQQARGKGELLLDLTNHLSEKLDIPLFFVSEIDGYVAMGGELNQQCVPALLNALMLNFPEIFFAWLEVFFRENNITFIEDDDDLLPDNPETIH